METVMKVNKNSLYAEYFGFKMNFRRVFIQIGLFDKGAEFGFRKYLKDLFADLLWGNSRAGIYQKCRYAGISYENVCLIGSKTVKI